MLFNSYQFLIFFPIVAMIYYVIPNRIKYIWLLITSYFFYMCWNAKYALLMLFSTAITYVCSILIEFIKQSLLPENKKVFFKKCFLALCFILNLFVLGYYKYANFLISLLEDFFSIFHIYLHIPAFDIILPVGISFYTFQALGYTMDVYRGEIYAERNFLRYALFVSFFPQLVAGPIERSKNLLKQLAVPKSISITKMKHGIFLMLWGYFLKVVFADRIAITVDLIYGDYSSYSGLILIVATVLFAFQIYCDFYGYSMIAIGAAQFLGIELMENFTAPYLSFSVAEFWRNWHISLTSWFKDYLYIPLGGSRKGQIRKYMNKIIVFLVSGLWHGADLSFVAWGFLNGIFQVIEEVLRPAKTRFQSYLKLNENSIILKTIRLATTFLLVDFTWIFFRADHLSSAFEIIRKISKISGIDFSYFYADLQSVRLNTESIILISICFFILFFSDICKKKQIKVSQKIMEFPWWVQNSIIIITICLILIFGIWGPEYNQANFIYFQF